MRAHSLMPPAQVTTSFSNFRGGCLRGLRLYQKYSPRSTRTNFNFANTLFPNRANADVFPVVSSLHPTENYLPLPLKTNAMKTEIFHHTQFHVTY